MFCVHMPPRFATETHTAKMHTWNICTAIYHAAHGRLARWIKWRACDVGEAKEGLENELCHRWSNGEQSSFSNLSVTSSTSQLILQPFRRFTYVTAHSQTLPLLHLRHSSFSYPSFASPTSQDFHLRHLASRTCPEWPWELLETHTRTFLGQSRLQCRTSQFTSVSYLRLRICEPLLHYPNEGLCGL